nr:tRNA lysidine(34) synthetase TilS [Thiocystis violacea]
MPTRLAPFASAPRCWIAFSGGLDSTVLLSAAAEVRARLPGELLAVHIDHGLQPGSGDWAAHCAGVCQALSIPIHIERLSPAGPSPGESLEAWAREARYRVFRRLLGPGEILLTAHHQDDQAETLLLALLRGSGVHGLAAMPFSAPLGSGYLVRPLLEWSRGSLAEQARRRGLVWIEDPSNGVTTLDRNYLRQEVLPRLRARWPAVSATLSRSASHVAEAAGLVDRLADAALAEARGARPGSLSVPALEGLDRPLRKAVFRLWLRREGFVVSDARHLDRILDELLPARADANPVVGWPGCEVRRYRREVFALRPLPDPPSSSLRIDWRLGEGVSVLALPSGLGCLEWRPEPEGARMGRDIQVRFGQTSLSCQRSPTAHRRSLKKLFQEAGVPVWLRPYLPMLFLDETLIAIAGVGACLGGTPAPGAAALSWSGHSWERVAPEFGSEIRIRCLDTPP